MFNLRLTPGLVVCLFSGWLAQAAQPFYFNESSATLSLNTLDSAATSGFGQTNLFTAGGPGANNVNLCTAMAVDGLNDLLFFVDGQANNLWSVKLDGSGLALVEIGLKAYPTDLALDVLNRRIYYSTSSTIQSNNAVHRVDYTGANDTTVFTATGASGNGVSRCTAIAVDVSNAKIFLADAGAQRIWSMSLGGTGLALLDTCGTNSFPTGVALDAVHQQVYFSASSTVGSSNIIARMSYNGSGLVALFAASGGVQRCTALDVDVPDGWIYLSDAGLPALWRIPLGGGSPFQMTSVLPATAKKVRWFSGPTSRPSPALAGIQLSGSTVLLNATNGYIGGTYYLLTATNLATPLSQWAPVSTNVLGASGSFSLTVSNSFAAQVPRRFYVLRVQ